MSYNGRLHYLGLSSLELRRLLLDLIYCYKIIFDVVNLNFSDFCRTMQCISAAYVGMQCLSVCLSVCDSVCLSRS